MTNKPIDTPEGAFDLADTIVTMKRNARRGMLLVLVLMVAMGFQVGFVAIDYRHRLADNKKEFVDATKNQKVVYTYLRGPRGLRGPPGKFPVNGLILTCGQQPLDRLRCTIVVPEP